MPEGNGVTRREFDRLEGRIDTESNRRSQQIERLDREGSRALGELRVQLQDLKEDVRALDNSLTWLIRAIAGVIFIIIGAVAIAVLSGVTGG